jgi:hypothetical protein
MYILKSEEGVDILVCSYLLHALEMSLLRCLFSQLQKQQYLTAYLSPTYRKTNSHHLDTI